MASLAAKMRTIFELLHRVDPLPDLDGVVWPGPFYIPRRRVWHATRFALREGRLYAELRLPREWERLSWRIGSPEVLIEDVFYPPGLREAEWEDVLEQVVRRLRSAIRSPESYNRRVARLLPLACRSGQIERRLTWTSDDLPAIAPSDLDRVVEGVARAGRAAPLPDITLGSYLDTVKTAYRAAFPDYREATAVEMYRGMSDGRHGGLLGLAADDAPGFAEWFRGAQWRGSHPWEIVRGNPQGIVLYPREEALGWRYVLRVAVEFWYVAAVRMAVALTDRWVPLEFPGLRAVTDALKGIDNVRVGCGPDAVPFEAIQDARPDAVSAIRWDPFPELRPITPDHLAHLREIDVAANPVRVPVDGMTHESA